MEAEAAQPAVSWNGLLSEARKAGRLPEGTLVCLGPVTNEQCLPVVPLLNGPTQQPAVPPPNPPPKHAILTYASFEASDQLQEKDGLCLVVDAPCPVPNSH